MLLLAPAFSLPAQLLRWGGQWLVPWGRCCWSHPHPACSRAVSLLGEGLCVTHSKGIFLVLHSFIYSVFTLSGSRGFVMSCSQCPALPGITVPASRGARPQSPLIYCVHRTMNSWSLTRYQRSSATRCSWPWGSHSHAAGAAPSECNAWLWTLGHPSAGPGVWGGCCRHLCDCS